MDMMKLKNIRKQKNLTLREMASDLGISYVSLWEYENGKKRPRPETALKLEKYTGIDRGYFIFGEEK